MWLWYLNVLQDAVVGSPQDRLHGRAERAERKHDMETFELLTRQHQSGFISSAASALDQVQNQNSEGFKKLCKCFKNANIKD